MPSAVPKNAVPRLPALQCVRMREPGASSSAPWAPMARFTASSSASMCLTSSKSSSATKADGAPDATARRARATARRTPQARFTAVGRAAATSSATGPSSSRKHGPFPAHPRDVARAAPTLPAHSATAAAPAMPRAGAPRTASDLTASTTTRQSPVRSKASSPGRRRWSM